MQALIDAESNLTKNSENFINTTLTDIASRFKEAYSQPQKIETKSDVNFNMTINGNEFMKNDHIC